MYTRIRSFNLRPRLIACDQPAAVRATLRADADPLPDPAASMGPAPYDAFQLSYMVQLLAMMIRQEDLVCGITSKNAAGTDGNSGVRLCSKERASAHWST